MASNATRQRQSHLARADCPFILRRDKHEVLDKLPSRTEVVLRAEVDAEEARLPQALRKQALGRLHDDSEDEKRRRFNILAALMRLRRAASHPVLVAPELGLPSSKLGQFLDLIEEFRDGIGRWSSASSLITSRWSASHRMRKVHYRHLDGQTPPEARQRAVDAFQRGEGDVFLPSLKAGGVG